MLSERIPVVPGTVPVRLEGIEPAHKCWPAFQRPLDIPELSPESLAARFGESTRTEQTEQTAWQIHERLELHRLDY